MFAATDGKKAGHSPWSQPLTRGQEGALVCTQRCTAVVWAVQLRPILASLGRKEKQVGVQSSQWKSNVKTTRYRQTKHGQLGQGFLAAVSFLNSPPWLLLGHPNEQ